MPAEIGERFQGWLAALEARHTAEFEFAEVTRALRALSSTYVERRSRLAQRSAFDTAGKRAAYALFYGPLHFLTVQAIVQALGAADRPLRWLLDLGCGAGAAGAAWAVALPHPPMVSGYDTNPWALVEAAFTYRFFGIDADLRKYDARRVIMPRRTDAVVAGWMVNELDDAARSALLSKLLAAAEHGTRILVIEPIATRIAPWWDGWAREVEHRGGRADEWRFAVELPGVLKRLDRAAGMRHDELTARSLYL